MYAQGSQFLTSLIKHKHYRDEEWVEFYWSPGLAKEWIGLKLSKEDLRTLRADMEKKKQHLLSEGYGTEIYYQRELKEGKGELWCGWDYRRYVGSVEVTYNFIEQLLNR